MFLLSPSSRLSSPLLLSFSSSLFPLLWLPFFESSVLSRSPFCSIWFLVFASSVPHQLWVQSIPAHDVIVKQKAEFTGNHLHTWNGGHIAFVLVTRLTLLYLNIKWT